MVVCVGERRQKISDGGLLPLFHPGADWSPTTKSGDFRHHVIVQLTRVQLSRGPSPLLAADAGSSRRLDPSRVHSGAPGARL